MQREIINLKYKILMRKPRIPVAARRKKNVKLVGDDHKALVTKNDEVYEDIQNLQHGGMWSPRNALP